MAEARSNRERVLQIARWLAVTFPAPFPVTVRCVRKIGAEPGASRLHRQLGDHGETYREGNRIIVRIAVRPSLPRALVIDTLLHEWAHAMVADRKNKAIGGHDDEWGLAYGKIYHRYVDDGGYVASREY